MCSDYQLTADQQARLALVTACDSPFFPLLKGLILSINEPLKYLQEYWPQTDVVVIDIGLTESQRQFLSQTGVQIKYFSSQAFSPTAQMKLKFNYEQGQVLRPYLPDILPEYSHFIWMDADIWIQTLDTLAVYVAAMQQAPDKMAICSSFDYSAELFHDLKSEYQLMHYLNLFWNLYRESFSVYHAEKYKGRGLFNCGFFALQGKSPIWGHWQKNMHMAFERHYTQAHFRFMFEQTALNVALYEYDAFMTLDPLFNYQCHAAHPLVFENDPTLYHPGFPHRKIAAVHLSRFALWGERYMQRGYLYQNGAYLNAEEKQSLKALFQTGSQDSKTVI